VLIRCIGIQFERDYNEAEVIEDAKEDGKQ
jgi:hypothetical protein